LSSTKAQFPLQLNVRIRLFLLAAVPLILAIGTVSYLVQRQFEKLSNDQLTLVEPILMQARRDEIKDFVETGRKAVADLIKRNGNSVQTQHEAKEMLRSMDFGADNYFFVYDVKGNGVMHPRLPVMETKNYIDLKDPNGVMIIQRLIQEAKAGGGFVEFVWHRPSTGKYEKKIGYAVIIPEWDWMIGSGLYLDAQQETEGRLRESILSAIRATRHLILLVSAATIFLVFGGVFWFNLNEQRKADIKVRDMAHEVVRAQELERTRVARELHDGVSQSLASVKFTVESADVHLDRGKAESASHSLKSSIAQMIAVMIDVRRISHDLYPTILDDGGLGVALEQLSREFSSRTKVPVRPEVEPIPVIKREVAWALYRFVQQALSNIESHAKASTVKITLRYVNGIQLHVGDDGVGFNVLEIMQNSQGIGLRSMQERIEMLGGEFEIQSRPGMTILKAYLPSDSLKLG
jgi:two-component system NarL family sensor kinase